MTAERARPSEECRDAAGHPCRICLAPRLAYEREARLKQEAFREFWKQTAAGCDAAPLTASPQGRHYRTVTHRKVFVHHRTLRLALIDPIGRPFVPLACAIEPALHATVYAELNRGINTPQLEQLADELQYVIVRGAEDGVTVILNIRRLLPALVQQANLLSRLLTRKCSGVRAVVLFEGGEDDSYYLGGTEPLTRRRIRKIFGNPELSQTVDGLTFRFSPFAFSQVNGSILPLLVGEVRELLALAKEQHLFDLYCGYGLFSLAFAGLSHRVTGVEASHPAVDSAVANAQRMKRPNVRFIRSLIDGSTIERIAGRLSETDAVILDPPRNGTAPGVVEALAARRPASVVHLFCNSDIVASDLRRWRSAGYAPRGAVPFDMFPGTTDIEVAVLLKPSQSTRISADGADCRTCTVD